MSEEKDEAADAKPRGKVRETLSAPLIRPQKQSFFAGLRSSFIAGVVVVAPIGITIWLIYLLVTGPMAELDSLVRRAIPAGAVEPMIDAIPGFGVLIALAAIIVLGAMAKNFVGRAFIRAGQEIFESVPLVRTLYKFFKNVFETALQQSERSFKEVALVEYPSKGIWVMAFVIGDTKGEPKFALAEEFADPASVFVPTVPNPTSGFLLFVPRSKMKILQMSVEDAAKVIFSLGLVTPEFEDPSAAVKKLEALAASAGEAEPKPQRRPLFRVRSE